MANASVPRYLALGFAVAALLIPTSAAADETCNSPYMANLIKGQEDYVYVWTLGVDGLGDGQDKLVTVDVNPKSAGYGKVIAVPLTVASVLAGDFFFMCLSVAKELNEPLTLDLASRALPHFIQFEFSDSSGYVSVLFGVLGALGTLLVAKRPVQKRVFIPIVRTAS